MRRWILMGCVALFLLLGAALALAAAHGFAPASPLPRIRTAPDFTLTAADGRRLALTQLRGKVVVVSFIYTGCPDECPLLTAQLAGLQARLGSDFGSRVFFTSITVDPTHDTPTVLNAYARKFGADSRGWAFLTGDEDTVMQTARRYGLVARIDSHGSVAHSFLTSIIDSSGMLRVQYLGTAFDPDEMLKDIESLVEAEPWL